MIPQPNSLMYLKFLVFDPASLKHNKLFIYIWDMILVIDYLA